MMLSLMSDDRKYKQRGYNDEERPEQRSRPGAGMPRMPVITTYKETIHCDQCGADLSTLFEVGEGSLCPKCEAPMHSCRNCYFFDTSARYECAQEVKKRVTRKSAGNDCTLFQVRTIRVKDLGSAPAPTRTEDARKALGDLFKK